MENLKDYQLPSKECFETIDSLNLKKLDILSYEDQRFILPYLIYWYDKPSENSSNKYKELFSIIEPIIEKYFEKKEIIALESLDYNRLESDARKDFQKCTFQTIRSESMLIAPVLKTNTKLWNENFYIHSLEMIEHRMRLVLCELITFHFFNPTIPLFSSIFDNEIHFDTVIDLIYYAIQKMPRLFKLFEIVEILLKVKNGLPIICRLITISPGTFYDTCTKLIDKSELEENNYVSINRFNVISTLCQLNPLEASMVRLHALQKRRMPNLIVKITMDKNDISDSIALLTGIFFGNDEQTRLWFSQYIKRKNLDNSDKNYFQKFRDMLLNHLKRLTKEICEMDSPSTSSNNLQNKELIITEACIMLKLYCVLRGMALMKLNDNEIQEIKKLITCKSSLVTDRFISICLCMILVFPQIIGHQETLIIDWFKWLLQSEIYHGQQVSTTESYGEMLLLIATFFHSNQLAQIGELVSSTLGIKHSIIRTNDLILIKHIFIQNIFPMETVSSLAVKVPVTNKLNDLINGTLPIHCIYQLLKNRSFTKYNIPIKNWIFNQLSNCIPPIHRILPKLIEEFVNSVLIPNIQSGHMTNVPIAEEDLQKIFNYLIYSVDINEPDVSQSSDNNCPPCLLTSQLLFLYYILLYEDVNLKNIQIPGRKITNYSNKFMSKLPIYYLIQSALASPKDYGLLRPPLIRLIAANYPHICHPRDWLSSSNEFNIKSSSTVKISYMKSLISRLNALENSLVIDDVLQIKETFQYLNLLFNLDTKYLWKFAVNVIQLLPIAMKSETPKQIKLLLKEIWFRLNRIHPIEIWVMTVNELSRSKYQTYDWKELLVNPIGALSYSKSLFDTPELMEIILHILNALLLASKNHYHYKLLEEQSKNSQQKKDVKKEKAYKVAFDLFNSTSAQILLDICELKNKFELNDDEFTDKELKEYLTDGNEVKGLICSHLHQSFIAKRELAQLIVYQSYHIDLISLTVNRIPSIHIFLDYIPEILAEGSITKKVRINH